MQSLDDFVLRSGQPSTHSEFFHRLCLPVCESDHKGIVLVESSCSNSQSAN